LEFEKIAVIGERETVLGFKLVGIKDAFIASGAEAVQLLRGMIEKKEYGLVIASNTILDYMDTSTLRMAETSLQPIIVFIPVAEEKNKESVEQLARRVLGVNIQTLK
jgi:V/A-type H+-transporting ATPase subunit F